MQSPKILYFFILLNCLSHIFGATIKARLNCTVSGRSAGAWYKIYKYSNVSNGITPVRDGVVYEGSGGTGGMNEYLNPVVIEMFSGYWHEKDAGKFFLVLDHKCCTTVPNWPYRWEFCRTRTGPPKNGSGFDFGDVELSDNCKPPAVCPTFIT